MINGNKGFFCFQWHITDQCDQRCSHCYIYSGHPDRKVEEMSLDQMRDTLERCLSFCAYFDRIPAFAITGGDPLLHRNFWQLTSMLKEKQLPFSIMGNPFHLNDDVCRRLKDAGCERYQLSIDGLRQTHDRMRRRGSFDKTLEMIECINRSGMLSLVMTTVSGENINEIPELIDLSVLHKVDVYGFARLCPSDGLSDIGITPAAYRELLSVCDKKFRAYREQGCKTYFSRKDHLWTLYDYEIGRFIIPPMAKQDKVYGGCHCGNTHLTILPSGDVWACRRVAESKIGNIWESRLEDLWLHEMEAYRNYKDFSKCSKCELLAWCRGCPAVAKGTCGDFYGDDPQCWKEIDV